MPLFLACSNEEQIGVVINPLSGGGKPALIQPNSVAVEVVSGNATASVDPANPNRIVLVSADLPGTTEFAVSADADLGAGVIKIGDTVSLDVTTAQAASLGLTAEPPTPKPVVAGGTARTPR